MVLLADSCWVLVSLDEDICGLAVGNWGFAYEGGRVKESSLCR